MDDNKKKAMFDKAQEIIQIMKDKKFKYVKKDNSLIEKNDSDKTIIMEGDNRELIYG